MSFQAKRELLSKVYPRYREANRKQKTIILDEFIASTGYKRKYAIRLLSQPTPPNTTIIKRPRAPYYGKEVQEALIVAWSAANYIASKRLAPFLAELVPALEHHGHIKLTDEIRSQLISISPATIDRLLKPLRTRYQLRGKSSNRSSKLLRKQIPVRTFADWEEKIPGYFEADLVAHCGGSMAGSFLYTLVLTDIATGWIECLPLLHRSKHTVINSLKLVSKLIPFKILGIDTDNGSEFINSEMIRYCESENITFTRGRAYKKNDQCYVEQKNGAVVRQLVGYDRFEGQRAYKQLTELYRAIRLYVNFFQPSMKLKKKERESSKVNRTYHPAQTPYQRLLASGVGSTHKVKKLKSIYRALDPIRLLKQLESLQDALWQHSVFIKQDHPSDCTFQNDMYELSFEVNKCGFTGLNSNENIHNSAIINGLSRRNKRRYRRIKKERLPRLWRTRKDPFENVWGEICKWLEKNPERTAKSLLTELQKLYPGQYSDNQLRTLQRRVQKWRANAIIIFDDNWINEDLLNQDTFPKHLKAVTMEINNPLKNDSNIII
jgi:hypothetical protein